MTTVDVRGQGPTTERHDDPGTSAIARLAGNIEPRSSSAPDLGRRPVPKLEAQRVAPADLSRDAPPVPSGHLTSSEVRARRVIVLTGAGPALTEAQLFAGYGLEP